MFWVYGQASLACITLARLSSKAAALASSNHGQTQIFGLQMPRDHANDNRVKGYGFITYEDFDSMDKAISKVGGS